MAMRVQSISRQTLQRLPLYVNYLKSLPDGVCNVSATSIAEGLGLNDVQVRKDLAAVSSGGKPKIGYVTRRLIAEIQDYLGYSSVDNVVIVGMGHLGRALTHFSGFQEYGQRIVGVFDADEAVIGTAYMGREILPVDRLEESCRRLGADIGIITAPADGAQAVCDRLVGGGVRAIWNFAPTHLVTPDTVLVQNENMAVSLALLSKQAEEAARSRVEERGVAVNG